MARRVGATAVAALALGGVVVACGGGKEPEASVVIEAGGPAETPAEVLARAADTTATVQSGRMKMTADYQFSFGGRSFSASVDGAGSFTDGGRLQELSMDMTSYLKTIAGAVGPSGTDDFPGSMAMRVVQDGSTAYMKIDVDPPEPGSDLWYMIDYADMGLDTSDMESPAGMGGGPSSYVETLRGAGADVVDDGRTRIDGVEVTRFEGTIDPQTAIERADPDKRAELESMLEQSGMGEPYPFTAYVDDDGVLRRMEMTMTMGDENMTVTATVAVDYFDFGADVDITIPPSDEVRPVSDLTGQTA